MSQFTLTWDNTAILASSNNLNQRASYRRKSTGGSWLTTGFTPGNDMANSVITATSPNTLLDNVIYEFKVEALCTLNGPSINDNGIREAISFACITPELTNTDTTSQAVIDVTGTDITKARFTLKKTSDNSIVFGPISVNRVGNSITALAGSLIASTGYYWVITLFSSINAVEVNSESANYLNSTCSPYTFTTASAPVQHLVWIGQHKVCETDPVLTVYKLLRELSSPAVTWYDVVNDKVYVADNDDALGNVYWFNPATVVDASSMVHSSQIHDNLLYNSYIDTVKRKIYFVGANSNGLIVYDIDTDTKTTVAFGTNGAFSRVTLAVTANYIYCNDGSTSIIRIDRNTLAILDTIAISGIASNAHFNNNVQIIEGNGKLYVVNFNNTTMNTIGVYNYNFGTHIAEITLPGASTWFGGFANYWQTGFFDSVSNKLYIGDVGSSKRFVIDTNTDTVIDTQTLGNKQHKTNVISSWRVNPITNELMFGYIATNTSTDSTPNKRIYIENRATHVYTKMFKDQYYGQLTHVTNTNRLVGCDPAQLFWNGSPIYGTDGSITILDSSMGTINTGRVITLNLMQVDTNNGNLPTGAVKPNDPSDPDYVAPVYSPSSCPLINSLVCPIDKITTFTGTTLEYEFSIYDAVKNNSNINKILIFAYNIDTGATEGSPVVITAPFTTDYYSGQFTGLGGSNYSIETMYLDITNSILQICH